MRRIVFLSLSLFFWHIWNPFPKIPWANSVTICSNKTDRKRSVVLSNDAISSFTDPRRPRKWEPSSSCAVAKYRKPMRDLESFHHRFLGILQTAQALASFRYSRPYFGIGIDSLPCASRIAPPLVVVARDPSFWKDVLNHPSSCSTRENLMPLPDS